MTVYRIAKRKYIEDLTGEGARLYGGRWNPKGTVVVYTAENRALATVGFLVHMPMALVPTDIYLAEIRLPEDSEREQVELETLPEDWRKSPPLKELAQLGKEWIEKRKSLLLRVPSAVVHGEWNILINPQHKMSRQITIASIEPVIFDDRLIDRK
ncbi:MAG: RES family NAD+ phosphorylase [Spirochaeta sp.]|jgi:RES domain-containing protein|nr:RES family NAD+ phosphorylase [Spirochaeta sp.]